MLSEAGYLVVEQRHDHEFKQPATTHHPHRRRIRCRSFIARIYVDSWNVGFTGLMPARQLTTELGARWERDLAVPLPKRWWVAEVDAAIVGFVGIGPSRDPIDPSSASLIPLR